MSLRVMAFITALVGVGMLMMTAGWEIAVGVVLTMIAHELKEHCG